MLFVGKVVMVYNRTSRGMRSTRRRRYTRKRRTRAMTVGRVKRIISAELKFVVRDFDFTGIRVGIDNITPLSNIAQGDLAGQRTGNWIQPINMHGYVTLTGTVGAGVETLQCRVGILRWLNDQSVDVPEISKIVNDPGNPSGPFSFRDKQSFKILWSRFVNLQTNADSPQFLKTLRYYVRIGRSTKALYDAATEKKNQLFFFALADGLAAGDEVQVSLTNTLRFTDS